MPYGTINADQFTTSDGVTSSGLYGFKNRIINGAMVIDQRNAGAAVTVNSTADTHTVDRWLGGGVATDGVFTVQQDSSAPAGFSNSIKITVTTADTSLSGSQSYQVQQKIEGFNTSDLGFGTANAQTITLSFWARSSLTGTFGGALSNSAFNRSYPFTYSISAANTWEYKTVTIAGDTTGTWIGSTNGIGLRVYFGLGAADRAGTAGAWAGSGYVTATGAVSVIGTLNATLYITGVQLEKGSTATSFDYRPYGAELQLCQRYYWRLNSTGSSTYVAIGSSGNSTTGSYALKAPVTLRATPSISFSGISADDGGTASTVSSTSVAGAFVNTDVVSFSATGSATLTTGRAAILRVGASSTNYIDFSAEL